MVDAAFRISRILPLPREQAFDLVVDRFAEWWPLAYTFSQDECADVGIEPMVGGACYEQAANGQRFVWGTVLSIERPLFVRLAWQIGPDRTIIADPAAASRVMIEFRSGLQGTLVELTHDDFVRHGEGAQAYRDAMASEQGWQLCLDHLQAAAETRR